jgi:hypothetical protein
MLMNVDEDMFPKIILSPSTSSTGSTEGPNKQSRRPPRLNLDKALLKQVTPNPESDLNETPKCGICDKSLPINPQLCNNCQIWNDVHHVFECLQERKKWEERPSVTVREVLEHEECMVCRRIGEVILLKFKTNDRALSKLFLDVKVRNYGPFCLGQDNFNKLNPGILRKYGRHQIDLDDLRLDDSSGVPEIGDTRRVNQIRVVVYLVLTNPPGSLLCNHFAGPDGLIVPEVTDESVHDETSRVARRIDPYNDDKNTKDLQPSIGVQLELHYKNHKTGLCGLEFWEDRYIQTSLLSDWLHDCNINHQTYSRTNKTCKLESDHPLLPAGFKVIDTYRHCIVDLPIAPLPSYAALSYTWGATAGIKELQLERHNQDQLREEGALQECGGIPDVIHDAITLCASMAQQYLWVDRLCIVQDDLESKMHQINAMDCIYHMASFTIVAAVPLGVGLPGVQGRPRKPHYFNHSRRFYPKFRFVVDNFKEEVLDSFWNTRGWTYQERILSRRAIYVTEWQTYYLCGHAAKQEEIGEFAASCNPWDLHRFGMYVVTVGDYTNRNLTFGSDILNAFAGIGNQFAAAMGKSLCYGLPERFLTNALLWEPAKIFERRQEHPDIPSWSWAAWKGRIKYDLNSRVEKLSVGTLVRFYFVDPIRGLRKVEAEEVWFWKEVNLDVLESLPRIDPLYPEMRCMPDAEESEAAWQSCPQNPWTVASHSLDQLQLATLSQQHPRTLVFRTTSAMVMLKCPATSSYEEASDFVKLDIITQGSRTIGQLAQIPRSWLDGNLDLSVKHEIIVLGAAIATEPVRYAQTHSTLHVSGDIMQPRSTESPWYLHVMLIERDSVGIAIRVGIGAVEMLAWEHCRPEWCTVVLG